MPHIHTEPGQHDFTTSAYIIRKVDGEWRCLVHMHRKLNKLMQIGGHVELNETPWQALSHELTEEAGYTLSELQLLQPRVVSFDSPDYVVHPQPLMLNTHKFSDTHFHTDIAYAFVAQAPPSLPQSEGESDDLRWLTLRELSDAAEHKEALRDVSTIYTKIVEGCVGTYPMVDPRAFSLEAATVIPADV